MPTAPLTSWRLLAAAAAVLLAGCDGLADAVSTDRQPPPSSPPPEMPAPDLTVAGTWPGIGGPHRDFTTTPTTPLASEWPAEGPPVRWRRPLGDGYSGIVATPDRVYTMYRDHDEEVVIAADASSGATVWEHRYRAPLVEGINPEYGPGPHSTPLLANGRLFTAGATAHLSALDPDTGALHWELDLWEEFDATLSDRGYANSPLSYGELLVVSLGGRGNAVVALRQEDGGLVWKSQSSENAYSSPLLIQVDGAPQIVSFMRDEIIGLHPTDGRQLWKKGHETQYGLNISLPVFAEDLLFLSSAYDGGSRVLEIAERGNRFRVRELWSHKRLRVHFTNALVRDGLIYASNGDFGPVPLTAVDLRTGEIVWRDRAFGRSHLIQAGERTVLLEESGALGLATLSPDGIDVHAKVQVLNGRSWTAPSLLDHALYMRNRTEWLAMDLP